jgi:hypothetical protein
MRLFVFPAKAGIQKFSYSLDSGSRYLAPAWPETVRLLFGPDIHVVKSVKMHLEYFS